MNKLALICLSAFVSTAAFGLDPWTQLGPNGVTVSAMATVPGQADDVFLVTQGYPAYVYYTSNAGVSWSVRDTIPDRIHTLLVDPYQIATMYCGGQSGRVYRSLTHGRDWQVHGTLPVDGCIQRMVVGPESGTELWASVDVALGDTFGLGVFRSTNSGATWFGAVLDTGFEVHSSVLAVHHTHPQELFVGGRVNGAARVFATTDRGSNWQDATSNLTAGFAHDLAFVPNGSGRVVCATDDGIFLSVNSGATWSVAKQVPAYSVAFSRSGRIIGYAVSDNLVYRSDDDGATWSAETTAYFGTASGWLGINWANSLELYAGNGAGVFHTTNGGFDWDELTGTLRLLTVPFLYNTSAETMYTCPPGYGVITSSDRGQTWSRLFTELPGSGLTAGLAVNPRDPDTVVVVKRMDPRLHLTTDRGDSWVSFPIGNLYEPEGLLYHPGDQDTLYTWGARRDSTRGRPRFAVYKSATKGQVWGTIHTPGTDGICLGFEFVGDGETLYVWGSVDGAAALYRSTNRGGTWLPIKTGIFGPELMDFKRSPASDNVYFCATPSGVFRTLNRGSIWTRLGLENVTAVLPDTADENAVWAGTDTQAIWYTTNAGNIWERDTLGLEARSVVFLRRHPAVSSAIFCSIEGSGLYGRGVIGIAEPGTSKPRRLTRVRPTLVSHEAVVHLSPGLNRHTTIDLYHADGRLAARIADLKPTPESHTWTRAPGLANGAYLLVLRSEQDQQVLKVILTKR